MNLVLLLETAKDGNRVVDRRLVDDHRLEPALERLVLLDVLAILVERRRADAAQLAAGECRLQHVGRIGRAFGGARTDQRVQLVDEHDDRAGGRRDLREHRLESLFELAAVLRAGDQRAEVERQDPLVAQRLGHIAGRHALGDAFDHGGLADAGLADQHGIVLRAPRQDLDRAADLVVTADHGIELALLRQLGEIAAVAVERFVFGLRILIGDALVAADLDQRREDRGLGRTRRAK